MMQLTERAAELLSAESSCITSTRFSRNPDLYSPADDFLPKPASAEELTRGLAALLNRWIPRGIGSSLVDLASSRGRGAKTPGRG